MYDVTNMDSFNHLTYWFRNVEEVRLLNYNYASSFFFLSFKFNYEVSEHTSNISS